MSLTSVPAIQNKLQTVLLNPFPGVMGWRAILRFDEYVKDLAPLDFTKLNEDFTDSGIGPSHANCNCGVDPRVICEAHPCYCGCRKSGDLQVCIWEYNCPDIPAVQHHSSSIPEGPLLPQQSRPYGWTS